MLCILILVVIFCRLILVINYENLCISNFLLFTKSFIAATNYYVAVSYGDDNNNGLSINLPFKTIGKAASVMSSGDICYIRQGRYHETISIDNLDGTSSAPVIFTNYNDERVVIDGTIPITSTWTQVGLSNLWRTKLTQDICSCLLIGKTSNGKVAKCKV